MIAVRIIRACRSLRIETMPAVSAGAEYFDAGRSDRKTIAIRGGKGHDRAAHGKHCAGLESRMKRIKFIDTTLRAASSAFGPRA